MNTKVLVFLSLSVYIVHCSFLFPGHCHLREPQSMKVPLLYQKLLSLPHFVHLNWSTALRLALVPEHT